jgi:hypothetical protein
MMLLKAYLVNKLQYIADKLRNRTFLDIQKDIQRILKILQTAIQRRNSYSVTRRSGLLKRRRYSLGLSVSSRANALENEN